VAPEAEPRSIATDAEGEGVAERSDLSPKNSGPDHAVPVIFRAIASAAPITETGEDRQPLSLDPKATVARVGMSFARL
jgi:hypothetical protein